MCKLTRRHLFGAMGLALAPDAPVEPRLLLATSSSPCVALTLDACPGGFDERLAAALVDSALPATIFMTSVWMQMNPKGLAFFLSHPDLFAIENHGARHLPPVLGSRSIFGIAVAGDLATIHREVADGADAIAIATGRRPIWYRAATGFYSPSVIPAIEAQGFAIAGYSLNADMGASLPAKTVAARIAAADSGDVIVAHINQPQRPSGQGVIEGARALQRRGLRFVHLNPSA